MDDIPENGESMLDAPPISSTSALPQLFESLAAARLLSDRTRKMLDGVNVETTLITVELDDQPVPTRATPALRYLGSWEPDLLESIVRRAGPRAAMGGHVTITLETAGRQHGTPIVFGFVLPPQRQHATPIVEGAGATGAAAPVADQSALVAVLNELRESRARDAAAMQEMHDELAELRKIALQPQGAHPLTEKFLQIQNAMMDRMISELSADPYERAAKHAQLVKQTVTEAVRLRDDLTEVVPLPRSATGETGELAETATSMVNLAASEPGRYVLNTLKDIFKGATAPVTPAAAAGTGKVVDVQATKSRFGAGLKRLRVMDKPAAPASAQEGVAP